LYFIYTYVAQKKTKKRKKKINNSVLLFQMAVMEKKIKKKVKPVTLVTRRHVSGEWAHSRRFKWQE